MVSPSVFQSETGDGLLLISLFWVLEPQDQGLVTLCTTVIGVTNPCTSTCAGGAGKLSNEWVPSKVGPEANAWSQAFS